MLLLDENLSWRTVRLLEGDFPGIIHVKQSDLKEPIPDADIWTFAKKNKLTIVTNDEDFLNLLIQKGFPPKVVLLKTGNLSVKTQAKRSLKTKRIFLN